MASGKTTYQSGVDLKGTFNGVAVPVVANSYVGLFTDALTTSHASGTGTEVSGGSYARVAVANTAAAWGTPATSGAGPSQASNVAAVNFVTPTGSWGTVNQFGVWDAVSGGNLLYWGDLTTAQTIASGNTVSFAISALVIQES